MPHTPFGIVGNMGAEADEYFQKCLRLAMRPQCDQDSLPMVVIKNPAIPDRTACILHGGPSPVPEIVASFRLLEACGVRVAVMPCNTAHYFIEEIQAQTSVSILNMIDMCLDTISTGHPDRTIGLLATTGTYRSGLYQRYASKKNLTIYPLSEEQQEDVHAAIYGTLDATGDRIPDGIKSGKYEIPSQKLSILLDHLQQAGVDTVILGCTELPLVREKIQHGLSGVLLVDPMEIVANFMCISYKNEIKT
jgi:aspartate racemase